jgi:hypothetical protein
LKDRQDAGKNYNMSPFFYCTRCGASLGEAANFCAKCGRPVGTSEAAGVSDQGSTGDLVWQVNVPLITNRFVLLDVAMGGLATVLISGLLLFLVMAFAGGRDEIGEAFRFAAIMSGGFGVFFAFISVVTLLFVLGNRCPFEFRVLKNGVVQNNVSDRARFVHRFAWILAVVTGRPLMAGPGLIAQSQEVAAIPWNEVRTVRLYPDLGVVGIRGGFLESVRLYCTQDNYAAVARKVEESVRQLAPSARILR